MTSPEQPGYAVPYQVVEAYGAGRFRISGQVHETSVLVFGERTLPWPVNAFDELGIEDLKAVLDASVEVEILLLGCGERMQPVPREIKEGLRAAGIVVEPMDTGAAARTFNLLLSEDRKVAAALILLP